MNIDNDINDLVWTNANEINISTKQIIRNINIHLLTGEELEEPYLKIYKGLKILFSGTFKIYHDKRFIKELRLYGKTKNQIYFQYNSIDKQIILDPFYIFGQLGNLGLTNDKITTLVTWYIKDMLDIDSTDELKSFRHSLNGHLSLDKNYVRVVGKLENL